MDTRFNNVTTRTEKIIIVRTARKMVTLLRNFISRRSTINNVDTVTRRVAKKRTYGRKKNVIRKNKRKR